METRADSKVMKASNTAAMLRKFRAPMRTKLARKLDYLKEKVVEACLSAMPRFSRGTILSAVEFRNKLICKCYLPILNTLPHCYGFKTKLVASHCLSCKVRGLVKNRHDESRDSLMHLSSSGFNPSNYSDEPLTNPCRGMEESAKVLGPSVGLVAELNVKRVDALI